MLLSLHVKNLAIIEEVEIEFRDHLNILTGETGAGKSILLGAIHLGLGGKIGKDVIRQGEEFALVELVFQVKDKELRKVIQDFDLPIEEGQIVITRKILASRSICKINGETVTASYLKKIGCLLIDIHGQHEHQSLLYKNKHLDIVDRFAKEELKEWKEKLSICYKQYSIIREQLNCSMIDEEKRLREISFLEFEINEIEQAKLKEGEEEQLLAEYKKLSNAKTIAQGMAAIYQLTSYENDISISNLLDRSTRTLNKLIEYDEHLADMATQLEEIEAIMHNFNRDLDYYQSSINEDGTRFLEVEERFNLIQNLKSKYGTCFEEIQIYYNNSKAKLEQYINYDAYMEKLKQECETLQLVVKQYSDQLSSIRKKHAKKLTKGIIEALQDLNFLNTQFEIQFTPLENYTENGLDEVEFLISTNPGEKLKPLCKVASGGELSRIMLAIKSIFAEQDEIDTLIFDEIDVGVSGRTAQKVSEKLHEISKKHQILCITHLPQITAMADFHYIIEKIMEENRTYTNIRQLKENESILELSRILGGAKITNSVIKSAKEMKELAEITKKC